MKYKLQNIKNIFFLLVFLFSIKNAAAINYLSLGIETGFAPNMLAMKDQFEALQLADRRIAQKAVLAKDYYGDKVRISDFQTSGGELISIPFGANLRYIYKRLFFKLGFLHHVIMPNVKSYVLNSNSGIDSTLAAKGAAHNFYTDYYLNLDTDTTNDIPEAVGIIPTDGKDIFFQSVTTASVFEIPFTFGFILIGKEFYKFYLGLGTSYFSATSTRTITVQEKRGNELFPLTGPNSQADVDQFSGKALGFHFLMGSEFQVTRKVGIYMEMAYSIGAAVPLEDKIKTGANTTTSLFHMDQSTDVQGVDESGSEVPGSVNKAGVPRISGLNFEHFRFSIGISYNIFTNSPQVKKLGDDSKQGPEKDQMLGNGI